MQDKESGDSGDAHVKDSGMITQTHCGFVLNVLFVMSAFRIDQWALWRQHFVSEPV